ncbi:MAG: hypothetical protein FWC46_06165 [Actinomycetia bacterium]|nr:hypothetical protein [Actinomycetes bacterium]
MSDVDTRNDGAGDATGAPVRPGTLRGWRIGLDVVAVIVLGLALAGPTRLGLVPHAVAAVLVVAAFAAHLAAGWGSMTDTTRLASHIVGALVAVDLIVVMGTGLAMVAGRHWNAITPTQHQVGVHEFAAILLVVLAGVHLGLNAGVVRAALKVPPPLAAGLVAIVAVGGIVSLTATGALAWFGAPFPQASAPAPGRGGGVYPGGTRPSNFPTAFPSGLPTGTWPSGFPTTLPSDAPSRTRPSGMPTSRPTAAPSDQPGQSGTMPTTRPSGGYGNFPGGFNNPNGTGRYPGQQAVPTRPASLAGALGHGALSVVEFASIMGLVATLAGGAAWLIGRRRGGLSAPVTSPDGATEPFTPEQLTSAPTPPVPPAGAPDMVAAPTGTQFLPPGEETAPDQPAGGAEPHDAAASGPVEDPPPGKP